MKQKTVFSILAVLLIGTVLSVAAVSAYRGDVTMEGPNYSVERHELMETAFANGDYDQWKAIMSENGRKSRVLEIVTVDNFDTFAQAHQATLDGNSELATNLRAELGLNNGAGPKDGPGFAKGQGHKQSQGAANRMHKAANQTNFIDLDNDGNCDNMGSHQRMGRN